MVFNQDPEAVVNPQAESDFDDELDEFYHGFKRYIRTVGLDATPLDATVHTFDSNVKSLISLIAGAKGIPMRKLLGSERGELASSQDEDSFNAVAFERQQMFADPIVRDLTDRAIKIGAVRPPSESYEVIWNPLSSMSDTDRALILERITRANGAQAKANGEVILTSDEIRADLYDKPPMEESS
jgi:hypothetical protein